MRVWVVDDDRSVRFVLTAALRDADFAVQAFDGARAALAALDAEPLPQLVFTDVRMPDVDGLQFLEALKTRAPELPVIVMSAWTDVSSTAKAFRGGAHEFLSKPFDLDHAVQLAWQALGLSDVEGDTGAVDVTAQVDTNSRDEDDRLIGESPAMHDLFRAIGRLAQVPLSVLISGETGTGKELVARALHRESPRRLNPFIALNTAAIPAELLESELFGHEAGSFTGATRRRIGRFEQADGGSLFLDEIGDMPAALQTRLLRVLAEGEFFRVGGRELIRVDVRVIAASHQPLEILVAEGRFRADLLHRLDVVRLRVPPLRERSSDIPALAVHFLDRAGARLDATPKRLTLDALRVLETQPWPGNVRELENICWRLAALAPSTIIHAAEVREATRSTQAVASRDVADDAWERALAEATRAALARGESDLHARAKSRFDTVMLDSALAHTKGHRQRAAEVLGVGRNTLTRKLGSKRKPRSS